MKVSDTVTKNIILEKKLLYLRISYGVETNFSQ